MCTIPAPHREGAITGKEKKCMFGNRKAKSGEQHAELIFAKKRELWKESGHLHVCKNYSLKGSQTKLNLHQGKQGEKRLKHQEKGKNGF